MPAIVWADIGGGLEVKAVHLDAFQPFDERRLALAAEAFADLADMLAGSGTESDFALHGRTECGGDRSVILEHLVGIQHKCAGCHAGPAYTSGVTAAGEPRLFHIGTGSVDHSVASGQFSNRLIGLVDGDELMVHLEQGRRGRALVNVCSRSEQQLGVNLGIWG